MELVEQGKHWTICRNFNCTWSQPVYYEIPNLSNFWELHGSGLGSIQLFSSCWSKFSFLTVKNVQIYKFQERVSVVSYLLHAHIPILRSQRPCRCHGKHTTRTKQPEDRTGEQILCVHNWQMRALALPTIEFQLGMSSPSKALSNGYQC